jgi:ATP-dependent helicase/nuclease subunit A
VKGWRDELHELIDKARANGLGPDDLERSAEHSLAGLLALLDAPDADASADDLDAALDEAIARTRAGLTAALRASLTQDASKGMAAVDEAGELLLAGDPVPWSAWAKLAKLKNPRAVPGLFDDVVRAACAHPRHPRLRADLDAYVRGLFACAAEAMRAFDRYKAERGLVDFVDQEKLALDVLRDPAHVDRLAETLGAVFVDEVQDSSPIQVAIFSALARIAPRSVWVGDPKQSIYAFRDADPELTEAAARQMAAEAGGAPGYLGRSYRSRPSLGAFVNAAFVPSFVALGADAASVAFESWARTERPDVPPALAVWPTPGRKVEDRTALLARAVARMLRDGDDWPIEPKGRPLRGLRGGDVAVLCRSNENVTRLASALVRAGVRTAVCLPGLMAQPEAELVLAALRWVADPSDTLAAAEVTRFTGGPTDWLEAAFADVGGDPWGAHVPFADALGELRGRGPDLTPAETLDEVLHLEGLLATVRAWGDTGRRLDHLEALRGLARTYQEEERAARRSVTLAGLCAYLAASDAPRPASTHADAVHLMTYHGAKGLEWPVVVLTDLEKGPNGRTFGLSASTLGAADWRDPLAGRVLRYWPWPYGAQAKDVHLDETAAASPEGVAAQEAARREALRLLYVGATRARDYLVLVDGGRGLAWLDELRDAEGRPCVRLEDDRVEVGGQAFPARGLELDDEEGVVPAPAVTVYAAPATPPVAYPPRNVRPSEQRTAEVPPILETVRLGERIALPGAPDLQALGEALHGLFAADDPSAARAERLEVARGLLERWGVPQLDPAAALTASERLRAFVAARYPRGTPRFEWPVHAESDGQVTAGRVDLLIDLPDGFVLIDHKSFPGALALDDDRLRAFAGQTRCYARAVEAALGKPCLAVWAHQPVVGVVVGIGV